LQSEPCSQNQTELAQSLSSQVSEYDLSQSFVRYTASFFSSQVPRYHFVLFSESSARLRRTCNICHPERQRVGPSSRFLARPRISRVLEPVHVKGRCCMICSLCTRWLQLKDDPLPRAQNNGRNLFSKLSALWVRYNGYLAMI